MTSLWRRWVGFTSRTEVGTSIAVFRILIGLCVVLTIGWVIAADLVGVLWVSPENGGMSRVSPGRIVEALGGPTPAVMTGLAWLTCAMGLVLAAGFGGPIGSRLVAFGTLQLFIACVDINPLAGGSYDELLQNALWLCVLAPTTATLSAHCRIATGAWTSGAPVGVWARYLIVFQLILMYSSTGLQKLSSYWTPGGDFSALYYILQQPSWHRFDMRWVASFFPLTQIGTAVSWFWEVLAPLWLVAFWYSETAERPGRLRAWSNRLHIRWVYAGLGILFHLALTVLMDVGPFAPITLAFYAALLHPHEWPRVLRPVAAPPRGGSASSP
jgi:hypothetical protein